MIEQIKDFAGISKRAFLLLRRTEPMVLSSSTAFFATFALSPVLILMLNVFELYFQSDRISNELFGKLASTVGVQSAAAIESIVKNFRNVETNWWMSIGGLIFFIFVGTTVLMIIKQNIHKLWRIRRTRRHVRSIARERAVLAGIIVISGGLFLLSLAIDSALAISLDYLQVAIPQIGITIIRILNVVFSFIVVTLWFTMIFKFLPDAKIDWEIAFNGAFVTAILFSAGRYALGEFVLQARIATIFGASASFAVLLLFIFYSSFIVYYGAAFTHVYADHVDKHICAGRFAHEYEERMLGVDRD